MPPIDVEAHIRHMAETMDLRIEPEWLPTVKAHMAATVAIATPLLAFELDDAVEAAPVFEP